MKIQSTFTKTQIQTQTKLFLLDFLFIFLFFFFLSSLYIILLFYCSTSSFQNKQTEKIKYNFVKLDILE